MAPAGAAFCRTPALAVALAVLLLLATACGSGGKAGLDTAAPPSTTSRTGPAPPTTLTPDAQLAQDKSDVTATIVDFNRLYDQAVTHPKEPPDGLFVLIAEPELTGVKHRLQEKVISHQAGFIPNPSKARTTVTKLTVEGDVAAAEDCTVNDVVVTDADTGRVLDGNVYSVRYSDALARSTSAPHGWVLTSTTQISHHTGADGCG